MLHSSYKLVPVWDLHTKGIYTAEGFLPKWVTLFPKIGRDIRNHWDKKQGKSRKDSIASFRLDTEHDLKRIGIYISEMCLLSHDPNSIMDKEHHLQIQKLEIIRWKYSLKDGNQCLFSGNYYLMAIFYYL